MYKCYASITIAESYITACSMLLLYSNVLWGQISSPKFLKNVIFSHIKYIFFFLNSIHSNPLESPTVIPCDVWVGTFWLLQWPILTGNHTVLVLLWWRIRDYKFLPLFFFIKKIAPTFPFMVLASQ